MRTTVCAAALLLAAFASSATPGDDVPVPPVRATSPDVIAVGGQLPDTLRVAPVPRGDMNAETPIASLGGGTGKPLVVVFWSARCPVCRRYAKTTRTLASDYAGRARLAYVFSNATETEADVRSWIDAGDVVVTAAIDHRQDAASRLGVVVTPTALVFDGAGVLRYRGPIDDDRRGRGRDATDSLRLALDAVIAGKPVENPEPRAFGSSVRGRAANER